MTRAMACLVLTITVSFAAPAAASTHRHVQALYSVARISEALLRYYHDVGSFPSSGDGLKVLTEIPPGVTARERPYLHESALTDPWGEPMRYNFPALHGDQAFDLYSVGVNGADDAGGKDDLSNWAHYDHTKYPTGGFWEAALVTTLVFDLPVFAAVAVGIHTIRRRRQRVPRAEAT